MNSNIPNRREKLLIQLIIAIVLVMVVCVLIYRTINNRTNGSTITLPTIETIHKASYYVGGWAGTADITYENSTGGTEQKTVTIPWTGPAWEVHDGDYLYISAQNNGKSGSVICEIRIDGSMVKQSKSEGAYVICTCSGRY